MKHISQIKNKIFTGKNAFPRTQDQKNLEKQKGELDSFMLSFSTHEAIIESVQKSLFEIYKARNMSGIHIREFRVEDFYKLKDGFRGTFEERVNVLEEEINAIIDGTGRDFVCGRVVELIDAALIATSYGGSFDDEVYDGYKSGMRSNVSPLTVLTGPQSIRPSALHDVALPSLPSPHPLEYWLTPKQI